MSARYCIREEPDHSWSVVRDDTGQPVSLAGIPQTGLELEDADELADRLSAMAAKAEEAVRH